MTIPQPKRYHYTESAGGQGIGWISEDLTGVFVTYQDWLALYQDYTNLEKKLEKAKKKLATKHDWNTKKGDND